MNKDVFRILFMGLHILEKDNKYIKKKVPELNLDGIKVNEGN